MQRPPGSTRDPGGLFGCCLNRPRRSVPVAEDDGEIDAVDDAIVVQVGQCIIGAPGGEQDGEIRAVDDAVEVEIADLADREAGDLGQPAVGRVDLSHDPEDRIIVH